MDGGLVKVAIVLSACAVIFGVQFATASADKPTWAQTKRLELRAEVDELRAENNRLRRIIRYRPTVQEALRLASTAYDVPLSTLRRKAWCESRYNPRAQNPSGASGLLQFLPSTFNSTPFARESIWSPYANALAAGWMHRVGRGNEWTCR
jgi:soluble lytic murein transglycosylase-like protein